METANTLPENLDRLHTTDLGSMRIRSSDETLGRRG